MVPVPSSNNSLAGSSIDGGRQETVTAPATSAMRSPCSYRPWASGEPDRQSFPAAQPFLTKSIDAVKPGVVVRSAGQGLGLILFHHRFLAVRRADALPRGGQAGWLGNLEDTSLRK
ncbi:MAG: hypothetical protein KatS3mg111_3652 [Pirellulaceae bacterium]|nr:MAG: hypothetical protein KatS3mg111_3652 [Pirellulaceae bacterium]